MRTTLAFPDPLILMAKQQALVERTSLTDLLIQGLELRLRKAKAPVGLPVSKASGGLVGGVDWVHLGPTDRADESYR